MITHSEPTLKRVKLISFIMGGTTMRLFEGTEFELQIEEGDLDVFSPDSPIGQVVMGQSVGSSVSFTAPNGKEIKVEIVSLKAFIF